MYGPDYFNPDDQTEEEKFQQVVLMSHEIGHHWIGNLVTMKWWNDLWINEAGFKFHAQNYPDHVQKSGIKIRKRERWCFLLILA